MRQFQKNVFRMVRQNKGSFLGAVMMIGLGIFIYVSMMDTLKNLQDQVYEYYETSRLADIFVEVAGISEEELKDLCDIPGIETATGRMAEDVRLLADGQEEIVTVHLLSYDEDDELNRLSLDRTWPDSDAIFLGGKMADIYQYETGQPMKLLWNGQAADCVYAGICHAPDYIYSIPPGGAMVPDGEVYDIACMEKEKMAAITGRGDSLNELAFQLAEGTEYEEVRSVLSQRLQSCGLISMTPREEQLSFDMVDGEMGELISVGTILPVIFMAISIFMLYVVLKKMIERDQSLIGTMKAFGLTDRELMGAYVVQGAAAGGVGAVLGSILAVPFGKFMFAMYVDFFNLPDTVYHNYLGSRVTGIIIAEITAVAAVYLGVRDILTIVPAQAMRARAPVSAGHVRLPDIVLRRLGPLERLGCRTMARNPFRGFLIVLAVAFPFSMVSVLLAFPQVADQMFMNQFEKIQVYDLQVSLEYPVSPVKAVQSGEMMDDVEQAEAICTIAAELRHENLTDYIMLYGLNRGSELWRIMDNEGNTYEPPEKGLIINSRIADDIHVQEGDVVEISIPGIMTNYVKIPIVHVIEESFGSGCYMSLHSFDQIFPTGAWANGVILKTKPGKVDQVKTLLRETGRVTWLVDTRKILGSYKDMMGSMIAMINMFALMAVAAGGVLIYNISMINIRERITEFGTLFILGSSHREIGKMLLFEQMIYFAGGILLGFPGSFGMRLLIESLVLSDSYTVHLSVTPICFLAAFGICLGITWAAWMGEMHFVQNICLTDVLKERE